VKEVFALALAVRFFVVGWAVPLIPPTADGKYYDVVARRIAAGHGYTWLWPDGAVTYAAHYPVGYPGMVGLAYRIFGAHPEVAMIWNALLGAAAAAAAYDLLARITSRRLALAGGFAVALHPALAMYTPALMTEGPTAALWIIAAALAARGGVRGVVACGLVLGVATLVRPQSLALAPLFGLLAVRRSPFTRLGGAILVSGLAIAVCTPWTVRNCLRMDRCALVSVNGGWNLAIGTQTEDGAWREIVVPDACKEVWSEAGKDACFGREAKKEILRAPVPWLARAPEKLRQTFDYFGAAPWYLNAANPSAFPSRAKVVLGSIETIVSRTLLVAALVAVARWYGRRRHARMVVAAVGVLACFAPGAGAVAYLALAASLLLLGTRELARVPLFATSAAVILATAATHAVFFGAGRYGLVVVPFVTAVAFARARLGPEVPRWYTEQSR
jgi:hypothetical protein